MPTRNSTRLGFERLEDRDVPAVTFTVEALANTSEGGSPANFRVTATGDPSDFTPYAVVAIYSAAGGTATFNSDFTLSPPSGTYLWFPSSGSQATVTVTPVDDSSYEGDEVVELRVQRYQMFPIGPAATGTMTIHDNDTPTVSVERLVDAAEGDTPGFFRFTRGGDTSAALTVSFEIDDQDDDFIATPGTDYQSLTPGGGAGSVTFAAGQTVVDLAVTPVADNEFEEDEQVVLTLLPSASTPVGYLITGSGAATVTIVDDAPAVSFTAEWFSTGETIGEITLTRTGGDINAALTTWFEPEGTAEVDGETVRVTMAATAVFPAGVSTLVVTLISEAAEGGFFTVQMQNAQPQAQRADTSVALAFMLTSTPGAGTALAQRIRNLDQLPSPLTYGERRFLRMVATGQIPAAQFGTAVDVVQAVEAAQARLTTSGVDWRTLPDALAPHRNATAAAVGFAAVIGGAGWARTDARVQQLITDLAAPLQATRDAAEQGLKNLAIELLQRGDLGRAMLVIDRVRHPFQTTEDYERRRRTLNILRYYDSTSAIRDYLQPKILAAAAAAGWVAYSTPYPTP